MITFEKRADIHCQRQGQVSAEAVTRQRHVLQIPFLYEFGDGVYDHPEIGLPSGSAGKTRNRDEETVILFSQSFSDRIPYVAWTSERRQ